eukprot:m.9274 g.9274  ORF g.9274 m.9274 type:complete len:50 (-) comp4158_c0_seq1:2125-2274(-)
MKRLRLIWMATSGCTHDYTSVVSLNLVYAGSFVVGNNASEPAALSTLSY